MVTSLSIAKMDGCEGSDEAANPAYRMLTVTLQQMYISVVVDTCRGMKTFKVMSRGGSISHSNLIQGPLSVVVLDELVEIPAPSAERGIERIRTVPRT